jgi:hypothetical protein
MDETTQKNATMVEESNAASHSLSQETSQLAKLVEQFQVDGRDAQAAPSAVALLGGLRLQEVLRPAV